MQQTLRDSREIGAPHTAVGQNKRTKPGRRVMGCIAARFTYHFDPEKKNQRFQSPMTLAPRQHLLPSVTPLPYYRKNRN